MENLEVIHADPKLGLTEAEAQLRKEAGLAAGVPSPTGKTDGKILLTHCFTFFNLIFLILAALLLIARSTVMNMGFLLVVVVNTVIGIFQELKAKRAVDQLALVARRPVTVIRDGIVFVIFVFVIFILVVFIEIKNFINFVDHFA